MIATDTERRRHAQGVGERILAAAQDWPTHDTTEGP